MRDPHLSRRTILARRIASGLPAWAVARGSNIPVDDVSAMMFEAGFRELVDAFAGILLMDRETRLRRMERIAAAIIDDALVHGDMQACMFVKRERNRKRDPIVTLAKGVCSTLGREQVRAEKLCVEIDEGRLTPETPVPEPTPVAASANDPALDPVAAVQAAAAMQPDRHMIRIDAVVYRKATALRQKMLDEQLLHHAVTVRQETEARKTQLDLEWMASTDDTMASAPLACDAVLSLEDNQVLAEIREIYRKAPPERLRSICATPPRGMEKIFAVLAFENGLGAWPAGP